MEEKTMLRRPAFLGVAVLLAISATPAMATIDLVNATVTCNFYSLSASASALTPKQSYTINYEIDFQGSSFMPPIPGSITFTAPSSGTFSDTVTGTFPTLVGSYALSGTATLINSNDIPIADTAIAFSPTGLTCAPPPQSTAPSDKPVEL
jgi:hypothetical protein